MKAQHWSQNELKPLNHNHQPQMLSTTDSKTHYQSKFSSSDQTRTASYDNRDTMGAWPMYGAMFGVVVTWKPCLSGSQITFPSFPLHMTFLRFTRVLCLKKVKSISTVLILQSHHWLCCRFKNRHLPEGKMLICRCYESYLQVMLQKSALLFINCLHLFLKEHVGYISNQKNIMF